MQRLLRLMVTHLLLIFSAVASADAVELEPENCPSGSYGTSSHAGAWCQEHTCDVESDCPEGFSCESTFVCVDVYETSCGGDRIDTGPCSVTVREVLGACQSDDDCSRGSCVTDLHCVDPGAEIDSDEFNGDCSGCSQGGLAGGLASVLGVLGFALLSRRRR